MREILRKIPYPDVDKLDARKVSAFVSVSTLFVALLASLGGEWVSTSVRVSDETACEQDIERARISTYFPYGKENTFSRTQIVDLKPDAFIENPTLTVNPKKTDQPFCPNVDISFTNFPETSSIRFEVLYVGLTDQSSITYKSTEFPANSIHFQFGLEGDDITFSRAWAQAKSEPSS